MTVIAGLFVVFAIVIIAIYIVLMTINVIHSITFNKRAKQLKQAVKKLLKNRNNGIINTISNSIYSEKDIKELIKIICYSICNKSFIRTRYAVIDYAYYFLKVRGLDKKFHIDKFKNIYGGNLYYMYPTEEFFNQLMWDKDINKAIKNLK